MNGNDTDTSVDDIKRHINNWYPDNVPQRANWLYRVDALRPHDVCEMDIL